MAKHFTDAQWQKISALNAQSADNFDLPERRSDSVIIGSFNIRKLGSVSNRTAQSWEFLRNTIARFDLIAIQEIMDDLSGLEHLLELLGDDYGMVVSDVTGAKPGARGNTERLGYLFNWKRVKRTALASDITFDRSEIANNLYDNRTSFSKAWSKHWHKIKDWKIKLEKKRHKEKNRLQNHQYNFPSLSVLFASPIAFLFTSKARQMPSHSNCWWLMLIFYTARISMSVNGNLDHFSNG